MKLIVILAATLMSLSALAGEYTNFGKIQFQSASTWVPANKVCQDAGFLYHKTKDFVVVNYCNDSGSDCTTKSKALVQPMNSTRQRCASYSGDNCSAWITVPFNQGTVKAEVYSSMSAMSDNKSPKSTYSYTVEACN